MGHRRARAVEYGDYDRLALADLNPVKVDLLSCGRFAIVRCSVASSPRSLAALARHDLGKDLWPYRTSNPRARGTSDVEAKTTCRFYERFQTDRFEQLAKMQSHGRERPQRHPPG